MKVELKPEDLKAFQNLYDIKNKNINIDDMLLTAFYYADFISKDFIDEKMNEGMSEHDAIIANIEENFSDDPDSKEIKNHIELKCLDKKDYINEYVTKLGHISPSFKNYKFKTLFYEPYQLFAFDDILVKNDYEEVSRVGYFKERFNYLALAEGKDIWMSVNPNEITTMQPYIEKAKGDVLVLGLGMGYITYMLSNKNDVRAITVVEKNRDNIIFFKKYISGIFGNISKIKIVEGDAIDFLKLNHKFDFIFADLWFTPEDGLEYYLKLNKVEIKEKVKINYWLNDSLKQMKRRYLLELVSESLNGATEVNYQSSETLEDRIFKELYNQTKNITIKSIEDLRKLLA